MTNSNFKQEGYSLKDNAAKRYFGQKEVFADLCNAFLFRQQGRLNASMLRPMPTEYNELILNADGKYGGYKRERDLAFQAFTDGERGYALLCAEFQSTPDHTMPVRTMGYDSLGYAYQLKNRTCDMAGKVLPISTMVVNIGSEPWSGPSSLYDMFPEVDDFVRANVPNYPLKVFDPHTVDIKTLDLLYTDLKTVSYLFRFSDSGDLLWQKYKDDRTAYLGRYGVDMVNICLGMEFMEPEEGRRLEMCKAVEDLKAMGRKEGHAAGRKEGHAAGRKEGIEEVAANALRMRMKPDDVQKMTGLSESRIIQIAQTIRLEDNCGSTILR